MKIKIATTLTIAALFLTGCSSQDVKIESDATEKTSKTKLKLDPGPIELTKDEAGKRYLEMVCQGNVSSQALMDAFNAHEDEFIAGGNPEVASVKEAASEAVRVGRLQIEVIDDDYYIWPKKVADQLVHIRSSTMSELSADQSVMNASTFEEAYRTNYPTSTAEQQSAPQEIRYQLGLDADTTGSCVGHETGLDRIHSEMLDRNKRLEDQEK